ncbi:MAG: arginase family protein [Gemmatimonadaceae bacterium]
MAAKMEGARGVKVDVIVVPFDSGLRDTRMGRGPDHLLRLGLVDLLQSLGAEVRVKHVAPPADVFPAEIRVAFELQRAVAEMVTNTRRLGGFPLVLSGNCNTAVGTVAGIHTATGSIPLVCWFDAHGDFNTPETTVAGFFDGMAVSILTGRCWRELTAQVPGFRAVPEDGVIMVGTRDLDRLERELLDSSAIRVEKLSSATGSTVASALAASAAREVYVHIDLDVIDSAEGRANGYAGPGGLSRSALLAALSSIQEAAEVGGAALTAYDPEYDVTGSVAQIALDSAAQLIGSAGYGAEPR